MPCQHARAHPRAGGENEVINMIRVAVAGSSPRGRGKRRGHLDHRDVRRLIPARAGKTDTVLWITFSSTAHPRAGGENIVSLICRVLDAGSSPRGRGKHH